MGRKRLILLGAGHAHLLLTERLAGLRRAGLDPLLIAPRWFDYSGLATGVLSGALPPGANRIDVAALAARRRLAFAEGLATDIDRATRTVTLADGTAHGFDLLSLDIGSEVADHFAGSDVRPVKPLAGLTELRAHIEAQARFPRVLIVGAGRSGTEVAAALAGLAERMRVVPHITLAGRPRAGHGWRSLYESLERRGIDLQPGRYVPTSRSGHDLLIAGTGLRAPALVDKAALGSARGVAVTVHLQSVIDPAVFAAGDCADFLPRPLPCQGVFAVRQAPVLARNLDAFAQGKPLVRYRPQRHWLAIMDLGDGTGFATWAGFTARSRAMLRWKRRLDMAFLRRFR